MRSRVKYIVPILLVVACVCFFWMRGRQTAGVSKVPAAQPATATTAASSSKANATNSVTAKLSAACTNRLTYRLSNTSEVLSNLMYERHAILLENALIDTSLKLDLKIPSQLKAKGDPGAYIVQAKSPINVVFRSLILGAGGNIISYIPNNAYLVQISSGSVEALAANPLVQAVIPYEPYYKVQSSILGLAVDQKPLPSGMYLTLGVYANGENNTVSQIQQLGGQVLSEDTSPFGRILHIAAPNDWIAVADLPGVQIVEPSHLRKTANDLSRVSVGVSTDPVTNADYLGLYGSNVVVQVNDSGIDTNHPDFSYNGTAENGPAGPQARVMADNVQSMIDFNGHGTHVAGIIAGNGAESYTMTNIPSGSVTNADFRGKAPLAWLYSVGFLGSNSIDGASDSYLQTVGMMATNVFISNNSWVNDGDNEYDLSAASYDAAVRDALPQVTGPQPELFVFAAGDDGNGSDDGFGGDADTINSPGTAKDVITVGSLEQLRNITNIVTALDGTSNAVWQGETSSSADVAGYSARGNVGLQTEGPFGRFKPDVVAPGTFVVSTRSTTWDQGAYYNRTNYHTQFIPEEEVTTNIYAFGTPLFVPQNAVAALVEVEPDNLSPNPWPTNFPIYVSPSGFPYPPDSSTYDFVTSNNLVSIPPNSGTQITSLASLLNNDLYYAIGDPFTNASAIFDIFQEAITTNDNGNEEEVLSNLNDTIGPYYRYETGTSMAAGSASGVLALMEDFFVNQRNPNFPTNPSPALLKAMLINGARMTGGYNFEVTNAPNIEGWGEIQLPNSIPFGLTNAAVLTTNTPMFFVDQSPTNVLQTGDQRTYLVTVPTAAAQTQFMRVTLAWTDPPGNPVAAIKLVNQLQVVVTNLVNGQVYYANNFGFVGPPPVSSSVSPSNAPVYDVINNVQNIDIPPLLSTNYSVTVFGAAVNVNAVTLEQTNIVQDFALVISCGDGGNTNGISVTQASPALVPALSPRVAYLPATNGVYFNQIAGSDAPWLDTNNLPFSTNSTFATNAVFHVGQTNQWQFYVITNTFAATNSAFTNAAFIVFDPNTLALPREGVSANSDANSTRPEAELSVLVASAPDPIAGQLTNLNMTVISNCLFNANGDESSVGRGGTKFVVYTNSSGNQVYYIGVQSQDQTAGQFGFIPIFSATPFSTLGSNGDQYVTGMNVPVTIPNGDNAHPGSAFSFGLALYPMDIRRVIVTNTFTHQNFGDLVGTINHDGEFAVLNNHDGFGNITPSFPLVYDDSGQGDITNFPTLSDGPGSLKNFVAQEAIGPWFLTEVDEDLVYTGNITSFNTTIEPHRDLSKQPFVIVSIPPGTWYYDYVDAEVGDTNLLVVATNLPPTVNPPIELFVQEGSNPTFTDTNYMTLLTNCPVGTYPTGVDPGNSLSIGPPLKPDRYFIGIFNPSTVTASVELGAILSFNASAITTVDYEGGPVPLKDDAVTYSYINVTNKDEIQEFKVGLRVDHPRISDLAFTLIDPNDNRYLLMENRGAQSTNGCGVTVIQTNQVSVNASGSYEPSTNYINVGEMSGSFPITYNFYTAPDEMTVYYGTNVFNAGTSLYDTGLTNNPPNPVGPPSPINTLPATFTVTFPPPGEAPTSTYLTIIMNQFGNPATNSSLDDWTYTAGGVLTNILYFTLTEDTNFTTTPVKYAPPPFVPGYVTNTIITTNVTVALVTNSTGFEDVSSGDYAATTTLDGWTVSSNQISVETDQANANAGTNFLALANGTLTRVLPTVAGTINTLTFAYRGPGIVSWWRGENNTLDSVSVNANNGTPTNDLGYAPGEVSNAFSMGTNGFVVVPASHSLDVGPSGFTIDAWVYPTNISVPNPIVEWSENVGGGVLDAGQQFYVTPTPGQGGGPGSLFGGFVESNNVGGVSLVSPSGTVAANTFSHVAITYNATSRKVYMYANGAQVLAGAYTLPAAPWTTGNVLLGRRINVSTPSQNFHFFGKEDEISVYDRELTHSEIKAIYSDGTAGKFDPAQPVPQNLAEMKISVPGITNLTLLGSNTNWQTNTISFIATTNVVTVNVSGTEPGMLLDSFALTSSTASTNATTNVVVTSGNLYYQPEVSLDPLIGTPANGDGIPGDSGVWTLEVLDNRAGATNAAMLDSWQLEFEFANTNFTEPIVPINVGSGPVTNTLPAGATQWYLVSAPTNAILATNSLLFSTLPLNMWWSTNQPPTTTNLTDVEMLGSSVGPAAVIIGTNPVISPFPPAFFTPGGTNIANGTNLMGTYYLGFQNTNTTTLTYAFDVTFDLQLAPPYIITEPATGVTPTTATLNADVVPNGLPTGVYFEYGLTTNYTLFTTNVFLNNNLNLGQTVAIGVTNLMPGTLYHFQAVGTNVLGTNYGGDLTFTTPLEPPFAFTMPATLENGNSAELNGMATPNGQDSMAWFQWGQSTAYGLTTPAVDVGTNFNVVYVTTNITGLFTNQPIHFRLVVSNSVGVTFGYDHVFAQANVVAWGADGNGQTVPLPTSLTNLVIGLGAGLDFSVAVNYNALPVAWGDGNSGQTNVPVPATNVVEVAGGDNSCTALKADGSVVAWGSDNFFQTNIPPTLTNAVEAKSGTYHSVALRSDGSVVSWGANFTGQTNVPASASNVVEVAGGLFHSIALLNNGTVIGWGFDGNGQIDVPASATNVVAIAAGDNFNLALRSDGTVVGWGENQDGQINTTGYTNVLAISAGGSHALALRNDGTVYAWGDNSSLETSPLPVGLTNVVAIASGENHNLALSSIYGLNVTNTPPFWTNNVNGSTNSMLETTTLVVTNTAVDTNYPPLTLNYSLLNGPSWASINPLNGIITFTPDITVGPSTNIITTVVANNGHPPLSATNSFTLIVIDTNTAPFFPANAPTNYIIVAGGIFNITNAASQTNVPVNPLTYTLLTGPSDATINATNGVITWPTSPSEIGITTNFVTVVTDFDQYALPGNQQLSATNAFTLSVSATNTGPYWPTPIPNQTATVSNLFTLTVWAADTNLPPPHLTYTLQNEPFGMTIMTVGTNGVINWIPNKLQAPMTNNNILVIVSDNELPTPLTATNMFNIVVLTNSAVVTTNSVGPFNIKSIVYTNMGSGFGYLLTWFAPSNDLFMVQWEQHLIPTNWASFTNIVSYNAGAFTSPTNTQFNFFDDGTQAPFDPTRFYRLLLLQGTNTLTLPNQTNFVVSASTMVVVTNIAVDSSPSATVTYSLLNPPTGAGITNGVITWPSATPQGLAARFITIASDNGVPPVTTSNQFTVFIAPFPAITNVTVTTTNVTLLWSAPTNDLFNVHWTTNLAPPVVWTTFPGTITSTTGLFSFTDTNALNLSVMRFYQLILLP